MVKVKVSVAQSCLIPCDPMDCIAHQTSLSVEFPRQENRREIPDPEMKPTLQ